jgi:7,8-dihydropterin-6-yl-methyl-4-(beta-D-ribofuranosyl)aminobenzene 5'-phosphate synthase
MSTSLIVGISLGVAVLAAGVFVAGFGLTRASNMKGEAQRAAQIIAESDAIFASVSTSGDTSFTALLENHAGTAVDAVQARHGISILVERAGLSFLMDLGEDDLYATNAQALGKDLSRVEFAFISHGHSDHGGALAHFLESNPSAKVYVSRPAMVDRHFVKIAGVIRKNVSLDSTLVDRYPDRFVFSPSTTEIAPDIFVVPTVTRQHEIPSGNASLFKEESGSLVADDFDHEDLLVLRDSDGLLVFSGCCHNGILNVLDTVHSELPGYPIKAVIGGFHLFDPASAKIAEDPEYVRSLGEGMLASEGTLYITGHCTGTEAYAILKDILGDRLAYFSTGREFRL